MASLFEVDPVTNEIIYDQEVSESGADGDSNVDQTDLLQSDVLASEEVSETQVDANFDSDLVVSDQPVVLSSDVVTALAASSPAAGSLNGSTVDYFDRLVSGLPSDYGYVAYRNSTDDAYAGTIIYGDDYDQNGNSVVFGEGAVEIDVSRVSGSGYSSYIHYQQSDASDTVVNVSQSGSILYYTNVIEGYPILGSSARPFDVAPFLVVGLVAAFASAVLNKLLNRRKLQ